MIVEEVIGSLVVLFSSLFVQTPHISEEAAQSDYSSIFEENHEEDEVFDGLIHLEYDQEAQPELPYYEEAFPVLIQADQQPRRNFCESFLRSWKANAGLVMVVVFSLGFLIVGLVYLDFNISDACKEWIHNKFVVPSGVRTIQIIVGWIKNLPLFAWFPTTVMMLWGFRNFRKNYLLSLFLCQLVTGSISCVYRITVFDKLPTAIITGYSNYG